MKHKKISVFEYDKLKVGYKYNGVLFTETHLKDLERFHASCKTRCFNLIRNGLEFCAYVGVIQASSIQIEILPKLDKQSSDVCTWRNLLIGMLREVGMFRVSAPSTGMLTLRSNSILELYFDMFITELEYLIRTGLIKQYRRQANNQSSLKGAIDFPRHLAKNLIYKERFYTNRNVYDHDHIWHSIFSKTIKLIRLLSQNADLNNRIGALDLNFPDVSPRPITEQTFSTLCYTRKTESYRAAIDIARLLLSAYHPDLATGTNPVLALMFDMNVLWESFVYHSLRKQFFRQSAPYTVRAQASTPFWESRRYRRYLRPDIIIRGTKDEQRFALDTKWKDSSSAGASSSDLQQLFAYSQFFKSSKNALLYPGQSFEIQPGQYALSPKESGKVSCSLINIGVEPNIPAWQESISQAIMDWMQITETEHK